MFKVYILQSLKDKRTYVGFAQDVEERLRVHNLGRVKCTRCRRPFVILFTEENKDIVSAKKRERYWKSGAGRRKYHKIN